MVLIIKMTAIKANGFNNKDDNGKGSFNEMEVIIFVQTTN